MNNGHPSKTLRQSSHECRMDRPLPPHGEGIREKPVLQGAGQGGCRANRIIETAAKEWGLML
jgi:hypothetical protein